MQPDHQRVWDALAHPARRRIVEILRHAPATTGTIHEHLEADDLAPSRYATVRHLQHMRDADLVLVTPRGRERVNALNGSALYEASIGWLEPTARDLADSLHALRKVAESDHSPAPHLDPQENTMSLTSIHVVQSIPIAAPRPRVWTAFREHTSQWWGAGYSLLDESGSEFELPDELGAPILERQGAHQAAWGILTEIDPGHLYAWSGAMGMGAPSWGEVRYEFTDHGQGTRVTVTHRHMGDLSPAIRDAYDHGWANLNARLRAYVEQGISLGTAGEDREPEFTFTPTRPR